MATWNDLHRRAGESVERRVLAIRDDQWHLPTPCTEWDVRDLVHHLVYSNLWVSPLLEGETIRQVGDRLEGDILGDDPRGAFSRSLQEASDAFDAEGAMDRPVPISRGPVPGWEYCLERTNDLLVHGWDVARAIGADEALDGELMEACLEGFRPWEERLRAVGALGPTVVPPPGAGLQARYLAFFGRKA